MHNEGGEKRVVVTKDLPGDRWLKVLTSSGCRVEVCTHEDTILSVGTIAKLIGDRCDGVIGQLTERWDDELFGQLKGAGGKAFSNYAVGYNNVVVPDATKHGLPVGNTPGASRLCPRLLRCGGLRSWMRCAPACAACLSAPGCAQSRARAAARHALR